MALTVVHLRFNYRCGSEIIRASHYALGEERDYRAPDDAEAGAIYFHSEGGSYDYKADFLFAELIPQAMERQPDLTAGKIAILYPAAWIGDAVANAARRQNLSSYGPMVTPCIRASAV